MFTADAGVQTDSGVVVTAALSTGANGKIDHLEDDTFVGEVTDLSAEDLGAILKWSQTISSDVNLSTSELAIVR